MTARVVIGLTGAAAAVAVVVLATLGYGGRDASSEAPLVQPPKTAPVTRATLVDAVHLSGTVGYGNSEPFPGRLAGTLTQIAEPGDALDRGDVAYRVDDRPVVVLIGELPAYRPLAVATTGADVAQFEQNLRALGYEGFTVDEEYSEATAAAVKRWQADLGLDETGIVDLGRVVYVPAPVRVAKREQRAGDQAAPGTPVLTVTGTTRTVAVRLDDKTAVPLKPGAKVQVRASGAKPVDGVVAGVRAAEEGEQPGKVAMVGIKDQRGFKAAEGEQVDVAVVRATRKDVLTVPIVALLAVADGYGVEVFGAGGRRVVPVTVGLFAQGQVEVTAPELAEGMRVGVAGQ
ncbi:peptidoglycan-binding protein [Phytohabitans flavus]|uniref:Peptidoglycan-binding protein n=2 Tax=Phytohabitans flavus TaxID=1076124 RepID=A0A6F8XLI3_9ACTN|nr:peptidoglycan-binding protein [Phytohabitans flavus]BCB74658.1 peptidoglycan-binding protein [Phytohabitans flavus]